MTLPAETSTLYIPMQKAEVVGRRMPEQENTAPPSWFEKTKNSLEHSLDAAEAKKEAKDGNILKRMYTSVGDTIRDVITANKMATEQFEGDTALMQIAKGSMTTLVGVGLERVLEDSFRDAISVGGKGRFLDKPFVTISEKTRKEIAAMRLDNTKMYDFVYHAAKDLATGVIYNGLAFFSRPMFKPAGGEHMLTAIGMDAMEALSTVGLKSQYAREDATHALHILQNKRDDLRSAIEDRGRPAPNTDGAYAIKELRRQRDALNNKIRRDAKKIPEDHTLSWQMTARKYLNYSNPATLLGLDMIAKGATTLVRNYKEVQKTRKEKGGLPGKSVYMPKGEGKSRWERKPWTASKDNRRDEHKDPVYFGKGQASGRNMNAQEEEDRAKLM